MEKCLLPFTLDVDMLTYHNRAFPLGVIKANIKDYDVWLCNKLINCFFRENGARLHSFDNAIWSEDIGLSKVEKKFFEREELDQISIDIVAQNKELLNNGTYIVGNYDEYFVKGKWPYHKRHYNHDYVIFGYDDKKKVFKSAAYMADKRYQYCDISYMDYYNSLAKSEYPITILNYKIDKAFVPEVDVVHISKQLENYLLSKEDAPVSNVYYGIEAWDKLEEYVYETSESSLDLRYGRLYMEHRGIMMKRMHKLNEMGILNDEILLKDYHNNVFLPAQAIHYLFIKYNITGNDIVRQHILEIMRRVNKDEKRLIEKMLEKIGGRR